MKCSTDLTVCSLTLSELLHNILREDENHKKYGKSDPRYLTELWCRVFVRKQAYAWDYFAAYYRKRCLKWSISFRISGEVFDDLYQAVLEKLMVIMTPDKFQNDFNSPWALNNYVRIILRSKRSDYLRRLNRPQNRLVPDMYVPHEEDTVTDALNTLLDQAPTPDEMVAHNQMAKCLLACVEACLKDEVERFIIYQYYVNGETPRNIARMLADVHGISIPAKRVSDKRYSVLQRLSKHGCADLSSFL